MFQLKKILLAFSGLSLAAINSSLGYAQTASPPTQAPAPAASPTSSAPLETVVVTARRNSQTTKIDRTTYDVRTLPDAPVSPAVDVIARLPGVFVGPNNRISIAGGAFVTILVDGRPMLRDAALQIPAERIASIDVISNPSAEFASSSEAIINIVLKKTPATVRLSGSIGATLDTLENSSLNLSLDRSATNWGLSASVRLADRTTRYESQSELNFENPDPNRLNQTLGEGRNEQHSRQGSGFIRLTRDFTESEDIELTASLFGQTLDVGGSGVVNKRFGNIVRPENNIFGAELSINDARASLTFKSEHDKDYKYETSIGLSRNSFSQSNISQLPRLTQELSQISETITGSVDAKFEKHLPKDRLFTTGGSFTSSEYNLTYDNLGYLSATARQSDFFEAQQQDFAVYATYQFKLGKFGILPGLRFEQSSLDWVGRLANARGANSYDRFLPSLFVSRPLSEHAKLRLSFSQGTTSLSFEQLNPALIYRGEFNALQGNPFLEPADRRTFELGYDFDNNTFSLVSTLFYRHTRNQIVSFSKRGDGELLISSTVNLGEALAYGLGSTLKGKINPKLSYTLDFEVSSNSFSNPFLNGGQKADEEIAYNGKFILEYKPNSVDQFSATTTFQSDIYSLGSVASGFWTNNFQFSHRFPNKVSLVINAVNIGVSMQRNTINNGTGFNTVSSQTEAARALRVGLTKRF